ncbi:ATP/GTP-binding protein [Pseudarthrobacter sp. J1738]|uniref:ATP/GTP-binding protein n=1 Tax=unclassified Pseudarthrobacter TaxID=2647000 RepID=UPI003D2D41FF
MPRSNRPRRKFTDPRAKTPVVAELDLERARNGIARREQAPDGVWMVRSITARNAAKQYVCPGCSRAIMPGIAHLVVWQDDHLFGEETGIAERRHWHPKCWTGRSYWRR